ncbi:MAG TPA: 5'-methylthioadenosine nucleosidase [Planctomycetaceae bacterium]|jgi:adenosylhomocysteine nucleosidase|nr:5'-methylthioadenosine nucleosidase [Planctomycetaceae bacterium]
MPDAPPTSDTIHADVGIVYATAMEMAPLFARCDRIRKYIGGRYTFRGARLGEIRIAGVQCGMGAAAARQATRALLDGHTPKWIISAGFSGALRPGLKVGDIVVGNALVSEQGDELSIDLKMEPNPSAGLYVGRLLMTGSIVRTVAEKQALAEKHGALAVDMESLAVAQACRDAKIRCLAVRAISDDLSADLPPEILTVVGGTGSVRLGAALGAIWKRPGSVKEMWRLRELAMTAADRLADFLEGVIQQLYDADH